MLSDDSAELVPGDEVSDFESKIGGKSSLENTDPAVVLPASEIEDSS